MTFFARQTKHATNVSRKSRICFLSDQNSFPPVEMPWADGLSKYEEYVSLDFSVEMGTNEANGEFTYQQHHRDERMELTEKI